MKSTGLALDALLATGQYFVVSCWTITLRGGGVVRWHGEDFDSITYGGNTWVKGPVIDRGSITEARGVEVSTLDMNITADNNDLINGKPLIPFIAGHGLDGASIKLEQMFLSKAGAAVTGSIIRFAGRVTSIKSISGITASLTVSSWMVLLNISMPRNNYQSGCMHTLYDSGCTLNPSSFSVAGSITGSGSTTSNITTGASIALNDFAQGRIVFTSGANAGLSRTIRSNDASGGFVLVNALPVKPSAGDAFNAFKGCDLTQGTCGTKFNNLPHFKATPFVPLPTAALGAASTTTTSSGKG